MIRYLDLFGTNGRQLTALESAKTTHSWSLERCLILMQKTWA